MYNFYLKLKQQTTIFCWNKKIQLVIENTVNIYKHPLKSILFDQLLNLTFDKGL